LKPPHRLTLQMNASQKQLSCSVQEHGAMMAANSCLGNIDP
jgi:hypothetical protein